MGSGKTTVGNLLSRELGVEFFDLDSVIERNSGMSIPELFKEYGEEKFRELERELLKSLLKRSGGFVISTGGGAPAYRDNMELINSFATSVFLLEDFERLWKRIKEDKGRPLVKLGKEEVRELYRKRLPYYRKASVTLECSGKGVKEVVEELLAELLLHFKPQVAPAQNCKETGHKQENKVEVEGHG
jgi:shikimate kinase